MADVQVDGNAFFERLQSLYNLWKADKRSGAGNEIFGGADSIVVLTGKAADETVYVKNNAVHVSDQFSSDDVKVPACGMWDPGESKRGFMLTTFSRP